MLRVSRASHCEQSVTLELNPLWPWLLSKSTGLFLNPPHASCTATECTVRWQSTDVGSVQASTQRQSGERTAPDKWADIDTAGPSQTYSHVSPQRD
ncbi:hypothetical protein KUCAC02_004399 [Chaenocephalus aceratus]|uniref:Uncharacterized protein n=1 Tax=Chaenocephalus aceratus TaxID=36190 RepID=A0ACB9WYM3_CHAAC|nr:hypothetical protein KUCAC02_004399 [Chaenocephalus aceratus]